MKALVSVIIPTYNRAQLLGRALQSVLDQTYPHWEAVVIDNHSLDNTDDLIASLNDSRIRLLKIHNHGVIAASRNLGMREARGQWLAFLDSDDYWYPMKLETIMATIQSNDIYDVLSNDEAMVNVKTGAKKILRLGPHQENFYRTLLVEGNRLSPSATLIRRDFLVRYGLAFDESPRYVTVEDYDLFLHLARVGARFKFINEVLGEYVIHDTNSSFQLTEHWANCEALLHDHVFNVQRFNPSPDGLWKEVSPRLRLVQVRKFVAEAQLGSALKLALKTLIDSPSGTALYSLSRLKKIFRSI